MKLLKVVYGKRARGGYRVTVNEVMFGYAICGRLRPGEAVIGKELKETVAAGIDEEHPFRNEVFETLDEILSLVHKLVEQGHSVIEIKDLT